MLVICELVVEKDVDVAAMSDDGVTALIAAASEGHAGIVELLLDKAEADPDAKDKVNEHYRTTNPAEDGISGDRFTHARFPMKDSSLNFVVRVTDTSPHPINCPADQGLMQSNPLNFTLLRKPTTPI